MVEEIAFHGHNLCRGPAPVLFSHCSEPGLMGSHPTFAPHFKPVKVYPEFISNLVPLKHCGRPKLTPSGGGGGGGGKKGGGQARGTDRCVTSRSLMVHMTLEEVHVA